MTLGIYICASDAERGDGRGSRRWVATGPSQALVTSAGGAGAQWPRDHQGWTLGRASGSQGWTPRRMDGHSSAWLQQLQCSLLHAPPASACSATCLWPPQSPRRVAIDMMELLALSHLDGMAPHHESAASSALTSNGWNHGPAGTSGGPRRPCGAVGGICMSLGYVDTGMTFITLRTSMYNTSQRLRTYAHCVCTPDP